MKDLSNLKQGVDEEEEYYTKFERMHARAGSPYDSRERVTKFIEGLDSRIKPLVHQFRERRSKAGITDVLEIAKCHGEVLRRQNPDHRSSGKRDRKTDRVSQVSFAERAIAYEEPVYAAQLSEEDSLKRTLFHEGLTSGAGYSISTPMSHEYRTAQGTPALTMVPGLTADRPGWQTNRYRQKTAEKQPTRGTRPSKRIVCPRCYKSGLDQMPHPGSDMCDIDVKTDGNTDIKRFEMLPHWLKATVPLNSYLRARQILGDHNFANTGPIHVEFPTTAKPQVILKKPEEHTKTQKN